MKKIVFYPILIISLLSVGCNKIKPTNNQSGLNSPVIASTSLSDIALTQTYTNTKYGYFFKYPEGYKAVTFTSDEVGNDSAYTQAKSDSNPVVANGDKNNSKMAITVYTGALPLTEENEKKGYVIAPNVTKTQVAGLPAFKLTFPTDQSINYELYDVQKPSGPKFGIQIPKNDALSLKILDSFKFIQ